jgi:hypothetical protein
MPTDFEELKRQLLQTDDEFRQLAPSTTISTRSCTIWPPVIFSRNPNNSKKSG